MTARFVLLLLLLSIAQYSTTGCKVPVSAHRVWGQGHSTCAVTGSQATQASLIVADCAKDVYDGDHQRINDQEDTYAAF